MAAKISPRIQLFQREGKNLRLRIGFESLIDNDPVSPTFNPFGRADLTGFVIRFRMKREINDPDTKTLVSKTSTMAGEIDFEPQTALPWDENSTRGEAVIKLLSADSDPDINDKMTEGDVYIDVWMTRPGMDPEIVIKPSAWDLREAVGA